MNTRLIFTFLLIFNAFACDNTPPSKNSTWSIYHWKSTYNPTQNEILSLKTQNISKIYLRFFDIDYDQQSGSAIPKAVVSFGSKPTLPIVPVVFITNKTIQNAMPADLEKLAYDLLKKIKYMAHKNELEWHELQIDCDWTISTRDRYFFLLKKIKELAHKKIKLSATIRLHQIKFMEKTGIPPVAEGVLMLYNVGDWSQENTKNSLFDADIIDQYTDRIIAYPIPLTLAYPIFHQTLVYRNGKFRQFDKALTLTDFSNKSKFTPLGKNRFMALQNISTDSFDYRKGDILRFETPSIENLAKLHQSLYHKIGKNTHNTVFFHLDKTTSHNLKLTIDALKAK